MITVSPELILTDEESTCTFCLLDCTEASDCADIGREDCSIDTPEQTCGSCLEGYVGEAGNGNSECICKRHCIVVNDVFTYC